jgi:hypothetical protein
MGAGWGLPTHWHPASKLHCRPKTAQALASRPRSPVLSPHKPVHRHQLHALHVIRRPVGTVLRRPRRRSVGLPPGPGAYKIPGPGRTASRKPGQAAWFADESPFAVVSAWHLQAGSCAVDHLSNSITFPSPPVLPVPHLLPGSPVGDLCLQARPAVAGVPRLQGWRRCRGPVVRGGENVQAVDREHPANGTWCVPSR